MFPLSDIVIDVAKEFLVLERDLLQKLQCPGNQGHITSCLVYF